MKGKRTRKNKKKATDRFFFAASSRKIISLINIKAEETKGKQSEKERGKKYDPSFFFPV